VISQRTVALVKEKANILDIVSESVRLKRAGSSYVGLCPFHSEKTGSFHVREDRGSYHCFGCGASGNPISFIMQLRGLSFPEAVEELAERYGISIEREKSGIRKPVGPQRQSFFVVTSAAQAFFSSELGKAESRVRDYLKERGLSDAALREFGIGFAPRGPGALLQFFKSKSVSEELALSLGLIKRSARGELYDSFRNRLIFPIFGDERKIVGFGGRLIPALFSAEDLSKFPKYINSSESPIYHKSKMLFGLPQALPTIRQEQALYIVEGYMDVVSVSQAGVKNVLAVCGTALTPEHVKRLSRLAKRVTLIFDGDEAGENASAKAFFSFLNSGVDAEVIFLEPDQDPDTLARKLGNKLAEFLKSAPRVSVYESYLKGLLGKYGAKKGGADELGAAAKGKLCQELCEALTLIKNQIEVAELIKIASFKLKVESELVFSMLKGKEISTVAPPPPIETKTEPLGDVQIKDLPTLDRDILSAIMGGKEAVTNALFKNADLCMVLQPATLKFAEDLGQILADSESAHAQKKELIKELLQNFGSSWKEHWKQAHEMGEDINWLRSLHQCSRRAQKDKLNQDIAEVDRRLKVASDQELVKELHMEKVTLARTLNELSTRHVD